MLDGDIVVPHLLRFILGANKCLVTIGTDTELNILSLHLCQAFNELFGAVRKLLCINAHLLDEFCYQ